MKNPEYKDLWNVDHGVTYIPWGKLPADLNLLCGGGIVDEDTLPDHLKGKLLSQSATNKLYRLYKYTALISWLFSALQRHYFIVKYFLQ